MNVLRWLVGSRLWVAFAAGCWSDESFARCHTWVRWTLVAQIFFLTWIAYLFLTDDAHRKYRGAVLLSLTGACVTFQGYESLLWPAICAVPVLLYRTHWIPFVWSTSTWELRTIPLVNNAVIAFCWVSMCMLWPMQQAGVELSAQWPFIVAAFCWVLALSLAEDLFVENMPDASLRRLGQGKLRFIAVSLVLLALAINIYWNERTPSVWMAMLLSLFFLLIMKSGKRTPAKSFLLDALIVIRFPF
ncbi:MAG: hypothetical protein ACKOZM_05445 [Flavobacteriales bacterium]